MPDILAINATITAIKNSIDIAKAIKDADSNLEKAELKLKIAELIDSLADAKIKATEFKELVQEKDAEIKELKNLLEAKNSPKTNDLPVECITILEIMSNKSNAETHSTIAQFLESSPQKTQYFLDLLVENKLIKTSFSMRSGIHYSLNESGRKFMFEKGLL